MRCPRRAAGAAAALAAAVSVAVTLAAACVSTGFAASGPAALTVNAPSQTTATLLHLQPGFATVLRADHRIDTVAIGDPRLVTATAVRRGQEVYDLVLQPQVEVGSTNMIIWLGDLALIWRLEIGPSPRTADVVYVVTSGTSAGPKAPGAPPSTSMPSPSPASVPAPSVSPPRDTTAPSRPGAGGPESSAPPEPAAPAAPLSSADHTGTRPVPPDLRSSAPAAPPTAPPGSTPASSFGSCP